jgi:hypothetical protein
MRSELGVVPGMVYLFLSMKLFGELGRMEVDDSVADGDQYENSED